MSFIAAENADERWRAIAEATVRGELGVSAKIAPTRGLPAGEAVVCCVYTSDFSSESDVRRVLVALRAMGVKVSAGCIRVGLKLFAVIVSINDVLPMICFADCARYKPDVYTSLGIYAKNPWRLDPTLYPVKTVLNWPE